MIVAASVIFLNLLFTSAVMDSATVAQLSLTAQKARMSEDRVNQFYRAMIRHVLEAIQSFSTLECPRFKLNHYRL